MKERNKNEIDKKEKINRGVGRRSNKREDEGGQRREKIQEEKKNGMRGNEKEVKAVREEKQNGR